MEDIIDKLSNIKNPIAAITIMVVTGIAAVVELKKLSSSNCEVVGRKALEVVERS